MSKWMYVLKNVLCIVYGGISGYITPWFLLLAFNFTDGIQNNPEGEWFVPFGVLVLVMLLMIDVWLVLRITMSKSTSKRQKALGLFLYVIAKAGGILAEQLSLQLFIECMKWKFEHQWLL